MIDTAIGNDETDTEDARSFTQRVDEVRIQTSIFSVFGYWLGVITTYVATIKSVYGIAMAVLGLVSITEMLIPLAVLAGGLLLMRICHGTDISTYGHISLACLISAVLMAIEAIFLLMSGLFFPFGVCILLSGLLLGVGKYTFPDGWLYPVSQMKLQQE